MQLGDLPATSSMANSLFIPLEAFMPSRLVLLPPVCLDGFAGAKRSSCAQFFFLCVRVGAVNACLFERTSLPFCSPGKSDGCIGN
jgi:hypothetical protein